MGEQKMSFGPREIEPRACSCHIVLHEGQTLKIETSPNGEEIFEMECPRNNGLTWTFEITVQLRERLNS